MATCSQCPNGQYTDTPASTSCRTCEEGNVVDKIVGAKSCQKCLIGEYSPDGGLTRCIKCPNGTFSAYPGASECSNCAPGTYNDKEGAGACQSCSFGSYAEYYSSTQCLPCPVGHYAPNNRAGTCLPCPKNYFQPLEGARECEAVWTNFATAGEGSSSQVCDIGYVMVNSTEDGVVIPYCAACPTGMICDDYGVTVTSAQLSEGYWRINEYSIDVYSCEWNGCSGGSVTTSADNLCADGYTGPLCQVCADGHYADTYSGACLACGGGKVSSGSIVALVIIAVIGLIIFVRAAQKGFANRVKTGMIMRIIGNAISQPEVGPLDKSNAIGSHHELGSSCNGNFRRLFSNRVLSSIKTKIKIIFVAIQIVVGFTNTIVVSFPGGFITLLSYFSFFAIDVNSLVPLHCMSQNCGFKFFSEIVAMTIIPILVCLWILFVYLLYLKVSNNYISYESIQAKAAARDQAYVFCMRLIVGISYVVFPPVSAKLFSVFQYSYYNDSNAGVTGQCYLTYALCLSCDDSYYVSVILPYVFAMIAVYPVGIPLSYFILLRRYQSQIMNRDTSRISIDLVGAAHTDEKTKSVDELPSKEEHEDHAIGKVNAMEEGATREHKSPRESEHEAKAHHNTNHTGSDGAKQDLCLNARALSLLFVIYEPRCWYFEIFECVRRLSLSGLLVFYAPGTPYQCITGTLICVVYLRIYASYKPFIEAKNTTIAELCQWQVFFTLFSLLLIKTSVVSADGTIGVLLIILNVGIPLLGIFIALYDVGVDAVEEINHPKSHRSKSDPTQENNHVDSPVAIDAAGNKYITAADVKPAIAIAECSPTTSADKRDSPVEGGPDNLSPSVANSFGAPSIHKNARVFPT